MICPKCNSEIKDGSKFCTNCGEPLPQMKKCVECGALIKEQALFCTSCGAKQPVKEDKPKVDEAPKKDVEQPQQKVQETKPEPKKTETPKVDKKKTVSEQKPVSKKDVTLPEEESKQLTTKAQSKTKVETPKPSKRKKTNWSGILLVVCIILFGIYKANKNSNKEEQVYQQQYVDFSKLDNSQSNENRMSNDNSEDSYITLEGFYNNYVFSNKDFSNIAHTTCTPKLLQFLKDAYNQEYECLDGECYAMWLFRTGNPDGVSNVSKVTNITYEGDGWVKVSYIDMGIEGATYIKFVSHNGRDYMDEIRRAY